jgi:hypothetical protein
LGHFGGMLFNHAVDDGKPPPNIGIHDERLYKSDTYAIPIAIAKTDNKIIVIIYGLTQLTNFIVDKQTNGWTNKHKNGYKLKVKYKHKFELIKYKF